MSVLQAIDMALGVLVLGLTISLLVLFSYATRD